MARAVVRASCFLASISHTSKSHRCDTKGPWWMPEHAVGYVTGEKHWTWVIFSLYSKPALCQRGDITSSLKAVHCKYRPEYWPGQRVGRALNSWYSGQEWAGPPRPMVDCLLQQIRCMTEALTLNMFGEYWSFLFYSISFSKNSMYDPQK